MKKIIFLIICSGILLSGCSFFKKAKITEMVPGVSINMTHLQSWLTIEFTSYPKGINLQDVKIVFSSSALNESETFTWDYIATRDVIPKGMMKGFDPNLASSPDSDPPLNVSIKAKYALNAKEMVRLKAGEILWLKAELYWGGKLMDSEKRTIEHAYTRK